MILPHAEHQFSAPLAELLDTILNEAPREMELVVSEFNLDELGDDEPLREVSIQYYQYFETLVIGLSELMGVPEYRGELPDAFSWVEVLEIYPGFDRIVVWKKGPKHTYLQLIWEDKDAPIIISLGAK